MKLHGAWDQLRDSARLARRMSWWLFGLAVLCAVSWPWAGETVRWAGVVVCCLACHAATVATCASRLATMQAALDMKRIALDNRAGEEMTLWADDELELFGHCIITLDRSAKVKIIR